MSKLNKKTIIGGSIFLILLFSSLFIFGYINYKRNQKSPLYTAISNYSTQNGSLTLPKENIYQKDSGEKIFLEAFQLYISEEYTKAEEYFQKALASKYSDPALPAYSYYYINLCKIFQNKDIDKQIIAQALEEISQYAPLSNDTAFIWNLTSDLSLSQETSTDAIQLLENYLYSTDGISLYTWAWLKNYIAMLEYNNEKYAKSIRHFYDVETTLNNIELTPELEAELLYTKEYIANIYFAFKDYEKAALLYEELVYNNSDSEPYNGYLSCINLATCYLEIPNIQKAKEVMVFLDSKLPQIPDTMHPEIIASIHDTLANIALKEHHYAQADSYLKLSEEYYNASEGVDILGGQYFIQLTRGKYLVATKQYDEALILLLGMLENEDIVYYGFEGDIYTLLKTIYYETGSYEKLYEVYEKLLTLNEDFEKTIQREYLEFSSDYKENNQLKAYNQVLSRRSYIAILVTGIVSVLLIIFFILLNILTKKNLTDQLTGIYNRKKLNSLIKYYNRTGTPSDFSVIMIDIDYFKKYNDFYGHPEGDKILKKVSRILSSCIRKKDILIRYGGEEFLLLTSGVSKETSHSICERIQNQINLAAFPHKASEITDHVTLSIGVCHQTLAKTYSFEALVEEADKCLYDSKKNGRNQFTAKHI